MSAHVHSPRTIIVCYFCTLMLNVPNRRQCGSIFIWVSEKFQAMSNSWADNDFRWPSPNSLLCQQWGFSIRFIWFSFLSFPQISYSTGFNKILSRLPHFIICRFLMQYPIGITWYGNLSSSTQRPSTRPVQCFFFFFLLSSMWNNYKKSIDFNIIMEIKLSQ